MVHVDALVPLFTRPAWLGAVMASGPKPPPFSQGRVCTPGQARALLQLLQRRREEEQERRWAAGTVPHKVGTSPREA